MVTPVSLTGKLVTATIAGGLAAVVLGVATPAQASTSDVGSVVSIVNTMFPGRDQQDSLYAVQPVLTVPLPAATFHRGR